MICYEVNRSALLRSVQFKEEDVKKVARVISRELGIKKVFNISVGFVDEKEMKKLNRVYRGENKVTDVLSFELDDPDEIGEIILCYPVALRQAKELKHSVSDELMFLLIHGTLHVLGFDHVKNKDAEKMEKLEKKIFEKL